MKGYEITPELEKKIISIAERVGVDTEAVRRRLDLMKKFKRKIRGVWSAPNWLWIATEQDTKFTWSGWTFSPLVPEGEYGSWYIWEMEEIAREELKPVFRWKVKREEIERMKAKLKEIL